MISKTDHRITSVRAEHDVLLRNKREDQANAPTMRKTVLCVHGATYGATDTFDYSLEGDSWMDHLAGQGFDVWCLDLLGYGQSDRPPEMELPPEHSDPIVDTAHAVAEVKAAVAFILAQRQISRLDLIGYSWGTAICGSYAGAFPDNVAKLVLHGALWLEGMPEIPNQLPQLGAYRSVDVDSMDKRWSTGLDTAALNNIVSEAARRAWCEHTANCDPSFAQTGVLRAPCGVIKDYQHCMQSGEDWYDPSRIAAPVLIVTGELDEETTPDQGRRLFARLTSAAYKQLTIIGQGTHSLMLENSRRQLHAAVDGFLLGG